MIKLTDKEWTTIISELTKTENGRDIVDTLEANQVANRSKRETCNIGTCLNGRHVVVKAELINKYWAMAAPIYNNKPHRTRRLLIHVDTGFGIGGIYKTRTTAIKAYNAIRKDINIDTNNTDFITSHMSKINDINIKFIIQ